MKLYLIFLFGLSFNCLLHAQNDAKTNPCHKVISTTPPITAVVTAVSSGKGVFYIQLTLYYLDKDAPVKTENLIDNQPFTIKSPIDSDLFQVTINSLLQKMIANEKVTASITSDKTSFKKIIDNFYDCFNSVINPVAASEPPKK
jgi:hypothetical protein